MKVEFYRHEACDHKLMIMKLKVKPDSGAICKVKGLPNQNGFYLDGGMNITPNVMAIHQTVVTNNLKCQ